MWAAVINDRVAVYGANMVRVCSMRGVTLLIIVLRRDCVKVFSNFVMVAAVFLKTRVPKNAHTVSEPQDLKTGMSKLSG